MQWFAFGGYKTRPFVAFGSRTDAALFREYVSTKQCMHLRFKEITPELGAQAARQVEVVNLSDRLVDIAIAEEVDLGDYEFVEEELIDA